MARKEKSHFVFKVVGEVVLVLGVGERWGVVHAALGEGKEEMIEPL